MKQQNLEDIIGCRRSFSISSPRIMQLNKFKSHISKLMLWLNCSCATSKDTRIEYETGKTRCMHTPQFLNILLAYYDMRERATVYPENLKLQQHLSMKRS
jgi:hypothetical protein